MASLNFQTVADLKALPVDQRNEYFQWIAGNGIGYDPSRHWASLADLADQGDWAEIAYQLPSMEEQIKKFTSDRALEYAQRAKEYEASGVTPPADWENTARAAVDQLQLSYKLAPDFVKGDKPETYDEIYQKVPAVNPYDTAGGVVYDKEQAAKAQQGTPVAPGGSQGSINFVAGLGDADKAYIQNLAATKDPATWSAQEKANWAAATGNSALPSGTIPISSSSLLNPQGLTAQQMSTLAGAESSNAGNVDQTGWTDAMKQSYAAYSDLLAKQKANGSIINPDLKIDDTTLQRFTDQAKTELAPYYGQLLSQAEADLKTAAEQNTQAYNKSVRDIGVQYGQQLENTQENLAARGLGLGQYRDQQEQKIKTAADTALQDAADKAAADAQATGTAGERLLGSANINSYNPTISTGQTLNLGTPGVYGLTGSTGSRSLFSPVGNTKGTQEYAQEDAVAARADQALTNYQSGKDQLLKRTLSLAN